MRGEHRHGLRVAAKLLQRDRMVDRIVSHLRRGGAGGGEMRLGRQRIACFHCQIACGIGQRGILREGAARALGQRPRACGIARMHRHPHPQQRFGGRGGRGGAHLLRSQPVIAIRPTGAKGGT